MSDAPTNHASRINARRFGFDPLSDVHLSNRRWLVIYARLIGVSLIRWNFNALMDTQRGRSYCTLTFAVPIPITRDAP